jgi:hypothetical protein
MVLKLTCPNCGQPLDSDAVNVANNVAFCRGCGHAYQLSELVVPASAADTSGRFDPTIDPPKGCWFREDMDGWTAGATTRSPVGFFLVPFVCVWSGFSLGGIYGEQIIHGKFNLFLSLFGIPFLLGSILFWYLAAMTFVGKIVVTVKGEELTVFAVVGWLGWRQRVKITPESRIGNQASDLSYPGNHGATIFLIGNKSIRFGSGLNFTRLMFLKQVLQYKLNLPT